MGGCLRVAAIPGPEATPSKAGRESRIRITPSRFVVAGAAVLAVTSMMWAHFLSGSIDPDQTGTRTGLQAFELLALLIAIFRLWQSNWRWYKPADAVGLVLTGLFALAGYPALAITVFAGALFACSRRDLPRRAAAALILAISVQAVWAPLLFSRLSFILLPLDARAAGAALSIIVPGAGVDKTTIFTPDGFNVTVIAGCSSFHNVSLASLCWVALTLLQRPYWRRRDFLVGLIAALAQIAFNLARLVVISASAPLFEYWHDGDGKHAFAAAATLSAILIAFFGASWASPTAPEPRNDPAQSPNVSA